MNYRTPRYALTAAALAFAGGAATAPPAPPPSLPAPLNPPATRPARATHPNIIMIVTDDLGYGDLGVYGQRRIATPTLDNLAARGVRCTSFYSGCTVCAPSRSALFSGMHTGHCDVRANRGDDATRQLPRSPSLARVFKQQGYTTGLVGKWGIGEAGTTGTPNRQGYDYFFGYLNQVHAWDYYPTNLWRNEQTVSLPGNIASSNRQYTSDLFTQAARAFITANATHPFLLSLHYTTPHANPGVGGTPQDGRGMPVPPDEPSLRLYRTNGWPQAEVNKAAMITRMDRAIGGILATLVSNGIASNTVLLFTSDNGPHVAGGVDYRFFNSSGPLRGNKGTFWEGGIRVPLIAYAPGRLPAGYVTDAPGCFYDLLPTVMELAGITNAPPAGVDGISLAPLLRGQPATGPPRCLFWAHAGVHRCAVRSNEWKLIQDDTGRIMLYDLATDLAEQNDCAQEHPAIVAQLTGAISNAWHASPMLPPGCVGHWPFDEGTGSTTADTTGNSPAKLVNMPSVTWSSDVPGASVGARFRNRFSLRLDGAGGHVATLFPGLGDADARSVCLWVKTPHTNACALVAWGTDGAGARFDVRLNPDATGGVTGAPRVDVGDGYITGTTPLCDGRWHHLAVVFSGTSVTQTLLYVDGRRDELSGRQPVAVNTVLWLGALSRPVTVGAGALPAQSFRGLMDDVALFNRALTPAEVSLARTQGAAALSKTSGASHAH